MAECRLYLITPATADPTSFADELAAALDAGDVACLQLRLKDADDNAILRAIDLLRPIAQSRNVAFILNDRPDLARKGGCDGVHVGQDDPPYQEARRLVGPDAIVGVTCHDSRHLAMIAGEQGADYVAFGAFFDSPTKQAPARATPELLTWWQEMMEVPCVAIGGITLDNAAGLAAAGADFLAVSHAVWAHPDGPAAAVAAFDRLLTTMRAGS
jgi:thiamine-phosphate pyrophosphorylase